MACCITYLWTRRKITEIYNFAIKPRPGGFREYRDMNQKKKELSHYIVRWVIVDNFGKLYKYQLNAAEQNGFTYMPNGILVRFYKNLEAVKADAVNIKVVRQIAETRRTGKKSIGKGCVITDKQFGMMNLEKYWDVWTSKGVELYNELTE